MVSRLGANGKSPKREILPQVGLKPTSPAWEAGFLTESPVSLPKDIGAIPWAKAAAEPEDDPPTILSWS